MHAGTPALETLLARLGSVPGWLYPVDVSVFLAVDDLQRRHGISGDLLEIGAYLGKSAILLGYMRRDDERLVVCDLFEEEAGGAESRRETRWYAEPKRSAFESNYLGVHAELPTIIQGPSATLGETLDPHSFRIVHLDGSHLYDTVRQDLATAKELLVDGGIVICDDYRTAHTPGVAAAVWSEVATGGLIPLCVTEAKLYGTWSPLTGLDVVGLSPLIVVPREYGIVTDRLQHGDVLRVAAKSKAPRWKRVARRVTPAVLADLVRRVRSRHRARA
jgi:hypothetical protein